MNNLLIPFKLHKSIPIENKYLFKTDVDYNRQDTENVKLF